MRLDRSAAPVRHQELAGLAARLRDAVRIGQGQRGAPTESTVRPDGCLRERRKAARRSPIPRPCGACPRRVSSGRGESGRLARPRSTRIAAKAALDQDCRKIGGFALPVRVRPPLKHHACEPRRQGEVAQMPAGLGDSALRGRARAVARGAPAPPSARRGRGIEKGKGRRIAHAPGGAIEQEGREIGGKDFGAREGFERARRRPPPTGDSRCPARSAPRGPGAGRPRRAKPARSRAASGRYRVHRPARAQGPNRSRPARPRSSASLGDGGGKHHLAATRPASG